MSNLQSEMALTLIESSITKLDENTQDAMRRVSWYFVNTRFGKTNILRRTSNAFKISQNKLDSYVREIFGNDIWIERNKKFNKEFYKKLYKEFY